MNSHLHISITSGGTRVPLDDVRIITNISSGSTGAAIASQALDNGHNVHYIANSQTHLPYVGNPLFNHWNRKVPPNQEEIEKFEQSIQTGRLSLEMAETFHEYMNTVLHFVSPNAQQDAIILSAAVSDFGPLTQTNGKIDSKNELTLQLAPLPKIRNLIRSINQNIVIVAFKQLPTRSGRDELFEKAEKSMQEGDHDIVVANLTDSIRGRFSVQTTWILRKDSPPYQIQRRTLSEVLLNTEIPLAIQARKNMHRS